LSISRFGIGPDGLQGDDYTYQALQLFSIPISAPLTFDEVVQACWETFKSTKFHAGIDRFGIVIGLLFKKLIPSKLVLTWRVPVLTQM